MLGFLSKAFRLIKLDHRLERLKFAIKVCLQYPMLYPQHQYPIFDVELCASTFIRNESLMHSYLESIGTKTLTYLQPANGVGDRHMSWNEIAMIAHIRRRITVDGLNEVEALQEFYHRVAMCFANCEDETFYDLISVFDDARGKIYIDQVHTSDIGHDLVARRIAEDILVFEQDAT